MYCMLFLAVSTSRLLMVGDVMRGMPDSPKHLLLGCKWQKPNRPSNKSPAKLMGHPKFFGTFSGIHTSSVYSQRSLIWSPRYPNWEHAPHCSLWAFSSLSAFPQMLTLAALVRSWTLGYWKWRQLLLGLFKKVLFFFHILKRSPNCFPVDQRGFHFWELSSTCLPGPSLTAMLLSSTRFAVAFCQLGSEDLEKLCTHSLLIKLETNILFFFLE